MIAASSPPKLRPDAASEAGARADVASAGGLTWLTAVSPPFPSPSVCGRGSRARAPPGVEGRQRTLLQACLPCPAVAKMQHPFCSTLLSTPPHHHHVWVPSLHIRLACYSAESIKVCQYLSVVGRGLWLQKICFVGTLPHCSEAKEEASKL